VLPSVLLTILPTIRCGIPLADVEPARCHPAPVGTYRHPPCPHRRMRGARGVLRPVTSARVGRWARSRRRVQCPVARTGLPREGATLPPRRELGAIFVVAEGGRVLLKLAVATIGPAAALPGFIVEPQVAPWVPVSSLSILNESTKSTRSHGGGTRRRRAAPLLRIPRTDTRDCLPCRRCNLRSQRRATYSNYFVWALVITMCMSLLSLINLPASLTSFLFTRCTPGLHVVPSQVINNILSPNQQWRPIWLSSL
jgi:hypothetical protein